MRKCATCGAEHQRMGYAYCLACHASYMRLNRPKHSALTTAQKEKANARAYARVYQERGLLTPKPCESCGALDSEKHHEDYSKPLLVRWLCRECHLTEHREPWQISAI